MLRGAARVGMREGNMKGAVILGVLYYGRGTVDADSFGAKNLGEGWRSISQIRKACSDASVVGKKNSMRFVILELERLEGKGLIALRDGESEMWRTVASVAKGYCSDMSATRDYRRMVHFRITDLGLRHWESECGLPETPGNELKREAERGRRLKIA